MMVKLKCVGVLVVLSLVLTQVSGVVSDEKKPVKDDPKGVRALKVKLDIRTRIKFAGKRGVTLLKSKQDVEKHFEGNAAKKITSKLDFSKENLVIVGWTTGGPPFGKLAYKLVEEKNKGKMLRFYVQEPKLPPNAPRGLAARLGADFFAVSKEYKVEFRKKK